jgi:hypothetical protein
MTTTDVSDAELLTFTAQFADGECLCGEIDPSDRPCLTCDGQAALRELRGEEPTFWCPRCERHVSYSQGALDETPALCDDCAVVIHALWEQAS